LILKAIWKYMMNKLNKALACLAVLGAALVGCGSDSDDDEEEHRAEGGYCQPCRGESRCDSGLTCQTFIGGGKTMDLCASPGTQTCSVAE
jgi:hypothetical protein